MALKVIMLRHSIEKKKAELEQLRARDAEFITREAELEAAINEAETEEQEQAVAEMVEQFDTEKQAHEASKTALAGEIEGLEADLSEIEKDSPEPGTPPAQQEERKGEINMDTRKKFFGMDMQQRDAFLARTDVKDFLAHVRALGAGEKRAVNGADLTIPVVVLDLIRENVMEYSKLLRRVRLRTVGGKARQTIMGSIPEGVWTEACASLNELDFGFSQVEVDGYKVGGIVYICKATLEDSDINLAVEIITALGIAIGIALDKAILYGTGKKMPLGIVTRLAQSGQPSDYPANARPWQNLSSTNMVNLGDKHGLELFQAIATAAGKAKGKYSRGVKFWAMNETTYNTLLVEAMSINASGAIVSAQNGTMPVIGGDIDVLSDDIIADGNIAGGYGDLYLLAERAGSSFERSDEYRFADDLVAFKGTARYDGEPAIAEGFVAMAFNASPQSSAVFAGDKANDASLAALEIGAETLSPGFNANTFAYTITSAAQASDNVNASPAQPTAKVTLSYDGKNYSNGSTIKWKADSSAHPLTITVSNGTSKMVYTVQVTKAAG